MSHIEIMISSIDDFLILSSTVRYYLLAFMSVDWISAFVLIKKMWDIFHEHPVFSEMECLMVFDTI